MRESRAYQVVAAGGVLGTISFMVVALRVFTRARIVRAWGPDDVLIVIAELLGVAFLFCLLIGAFNGMGSHIETLTPEELVLFLQVNWGSSFAYTYQTMFAKLSVLIFYRRVMGHYTWFRWGVDITMAVVVLIGIGSGVMLFMSCRPFSYNWDRSTPGGYCWDLLLAYFVNAGWNIAVDVVITALPLPLLHRLQVPKREKIVLCVLFSLGGLVCGISIVHVVQLPALHHSEDISWDITSAMIWYFVEAALIMIAACGPALKPFFRLHMPGLLGNTRGTDKNSAPYAVGENHNMKRFQRSSSVTTGPRAKFGEGDSKEHIIDEESGIIKTTDVVLTVEDIPGPEDGGYGRRGSQTP